MSAAFSAHHLPLQWPTNLTFRIFRKLL
jgi:hypothetical protein